MNLIEDVSLLYVEDDDDVFYMLEKFLRNRFKNLYTAKDGEEGLEQYIKYKPDIILTDVNMPKMDGLSMIEQIKKINKKIKCSIISAFNDTDYLQKAILLGVNLYITKPIIKDDIQNKLDELVEQVRLERIKENYTQELEKKIVEETQKRVEQERLLMQQSRFIILGEMIGSMAHQLKQPLNLMSITIENIEDIFKTQEELNEFKPLKEQLISAINHMSETINVFRNFLKPQEDKRSFELISALYDVFLLTNKMLTNSNIKWSVSFNDLTLFSLNEIKSCQKKLHLFGDSNEFKQVAMNLIANSRDAILEEQKSKKKDWGIKIDIKEQPDSVDISFSDNGGGIKQEALSKLFEPYVSTKGEKGTGIGLYMSKQIINKMKGTIDVKNLEDGALFKIHLLKDKI